MYGGVGTNKFLRCNRDKSSAYEQNIMIPDGKN